eukprot:145219-Pelagomonas_calceolata.AAC.7
MNHQEQHSTHIERDRPLPGWPPAACAWLWGRLAWQLGHCRLMQLPAAAPARMVTVWMLKSGTPQSPKRKPLQGVKQLPFDSTCTRSTGASLPVPHAEARDDKALALVVQVSSASLLSVSNPTYHIKAAAGPSSISPTVSGVQKSSQSKALHLIPHLPHQGRCRSQQHRPVVSRVQNYNSPKPCTSFPTHHIKAAAGASSISPSVNCV